MPQIQGQVNPFSNAICDDVYPTLLGKRDSLFTTKGEE